MLKFYKLLNVTVVTISILTTTEIIQKTPSFSQSDLQTQTPRESSEGELTEEIIQEEINPAINPLLFPTKPEEVNVEAVVPISLESALEIGFRNNQELELARLQLNQAQNQLREATAGLFPILDLDFNFQYVSSANVEIRNRELELGLNPDGSITEVNPLFLEQQTADPTSFSVDGQLELAYNVYTGGSRSATIKRERRRVRSEQLNVESIQEDVRFTITSNYYELQNADAQVAIAQAAVEDATQSLRDAQLRERAGLGTRFDVLQAEVDLANASQGLTRAIADQRTARRQLAETLSLTQTVEFSAADEIEPAQDWVLSLNESIVLAYKNRAELERFLLEREIGEQNKQIALSEIRPQLSIFANYNFLDNDLSDPVSVADGYAFGGRLRWRLFDGGRAIARARQAEDDIEIAETQFAQQRNQIRLQVESAYYDLIANKDNIDTAQQAVITAEERLRLARLRFQAGVGTQTEVIDAQRDLTEARGNFLQAVIGYNQSLNELERAVSNFPDDRLFQLR